MEIPGLKFLLTVTVWRTVNTRIEEQVDYERQAEIWPIKHHINKNKFRLINITCS